MNTLTYELTRTLSILRLYIHLTEQTLPYVSGEKRQRAVAILARLDQQEAKFNERLAQVVDDIR